MELQEFVSETITQIIEGIAKARENIESNKNELIKTAQVAPPVNATNSGPVDILELAPENHYGRVRAWPLAFDVAVTLVEKTDSQKGSRLTIGLVGIGGSFGSDKGSRHENAEVARINFTIPILWPQDKGGQRHVGAVSTGARSY